MLVIVVECCRLRLVGVGCWCLLALVGRLVAVGGGVCCWFALAVVGFGWLLTARDG